MLTCAQVEETGRSNWLYLMNVWSWRYNAVLGIRRATTADQVRIPFCHAFLFSLSWKHGNCFFRAVECFTQRKPKSHGTVRVFRAYVCNQHRTRTVSQFLDRSHVWCDLDVDIKNVKATELLAEHKPTSGLELHNLTRYDYRLWMACNILGWMCSMRYFSLAVLCSVTYERLFTITSS
jgi:hypothetical protein